MPVANDFKCKDCKNMYELKLPREVLKVAECPGCGAVGTLRLQLTQINQALATVPDGGGRFDHIREQTKLQIEGANSKTQEDRDRIKKEIKKVNAKK